MRSSFDGIRRGREYLAMATVQYCVPQLQYALLHRRCKANNRLHFLKIATGKICFSSSSSYLPIQSAVDLAYLYLLWPLCFYYRPSRLEAENSPTSWCNNLKHSDSTHSSAKRILKKHATLLKCQFPYSSISLNLTHSIRYLNLPSSLCKQLSRSSDSLVTLQERDTLLLLTHSLSSHPQTVSSSGPNTSHHETAIQSSNNIWEQISLPYRCTTSVHKTTANLKSPRTLATRLKPRRLKVRQCHVSTSMRPRTVCNKSFPPSNLHNYATIELPGSQESLVTSALP